MRFHRKAVVILLSLALAPVASHAAELETLGAMHQTNIAVYWQPIPQTGWFARCKDTEGNAFSLFQADESVPGDFSEG